MGAISDALDELAATITGAGYTVVQDPRLIRPGVVVIDPPTLTGLSAAISQLDIDVSVLTQPLGPAEQLTYLLDAVDEITSLVPVTSATYGIYNAGNQELPSYTCTVRLTIQR
jgi:hypothetical protein